MLLRVSPVSKRSFKLMVMEVAAGLEGLEFALAVADAAGGITCANSSPEGNAGVFGEASAFSAAGAGAATESSGGGSPEPGAAVAGTDCGSATSWVEATGCRVTMMVSPASVEMPPASAR